ncbi:molybdopterin-dependent oxidoreductase [Peptoniphilus equinus]|uniref:Molybdopterin-dependent oxidoreductase n=1 Tax=Peptoniphilus equinus TaxID=3016343 RepID=A0ABY7QT84_9FIRM|nr:molybdopterin cofactor-binding domain-containing protein [Peptoniphilus equinus]WBW49999.1 molybdopterin-dependent oxidoreductase [Peptoniphilus equinus]
MQSYKYVGKRLQRPDSYEKVTGETKFVEDIKRHNMLYGKLVISDQAHARFHIDAEAALQLEGVYKVLTFKDIPHVPYNSMEWYSGIEALKDEYLLCDVARFVGDRLALVLGTSKSVVEKACKLVQVTYEPLPCVIGVEAAKKDGTIVKGDTNLSYEKTFACGDYEKAFKEADYIIRDRGTTPRTHHLTLEPYCALSEIDQFGNLVVFSGNQIVFAIQRQLSRILNLPYHQIRVVKANMGGSFGARQQPMVELLAAYVAWEEKRPVQVYLDRPQSMVSVAARTSMDISVATALKKDGTILGRYVEADVDGGAYDTNSMTILGASAKKLFRLYKINHQTYVGRAYFTNAIPSGATRAYGGPQIHAITEININHAAQALGLDPCEFRLKNLVDPWADDPSGGPNLGKAEIKQCVELGMEQFQWKDKFAHIKERDDDRYAYGVGVACATHGSGYFGAYPDFINVEMDLSANGDVLCKVAVHDQGCGTLLTLGQIAAEALDMPLSKIRITEADTFITPYDAAGTQASRVTFVAGGAIKEAGEKMVHLLFETLYEVKGHHIGDMYTCDGKVRIKNEDLEYTYGDISTLREKFMHEKTTVFLKYKPTANPATLAACFAQVKVDKKTGQVDIEHFLAAHDIGRAINPLMVEGQIQGGVHFSLGMALSEEIDIDKNGKVKNMTLSKYHMLNVNDVPPIDIVLVESDDDSAPYGLKSIGEVTAVAPAPAILGAINHALGTHMCDYPATPEKIIAAIAALEEKESDA